MKHNTLLIGLVAIEIAVFASLGCGGHKSAAGPSNPSDQIPAPTGGGSAAMPSGSAKTRDGIPQSWWQKSNGTPVHGATLAEVMFNLNKEITNNELNFVIYNVGGYSTQGFPAGATFHDVQNAGFNRWRVFFYTDPNALVIAMSADYGHVQFFVNRVNDCFTALRDKEKVWQRPCHALKVEDGSPAKVLEYVKKLDPTGKYKTDGTPPKLRMDLMLDGIPLEQAVTYLGWAAGAQLNFSSDGTLYFQFR